MSKAIGTTIPMINVVLPPPLLLLLVSSEGGGDAGYGAEGWSVVVVVLSDCKNHRLTDERMFSFGNLIIAIINY